MEAPKSKAKSVQLTAAASKELAWYESAMGAGVLAPAGWHCFGTYGSGGDELIVSLQAIDTTHIFSSDQESFGPAIVMLHIFGDTFSRFGVAEVIARVFPSFKPFIAEVEKAYQIQPGSFTTGPYPGDTMVYKGKVVVEYKTAAGAEGLGTDGWLKKSYTPIDGVAMLVGETPDLLLLAVRLPKDLSQLTAQIIRQFERDNPPASK
jgi:hypothetical protein